MTSGCKNGGLAALEPLIGEWEFTIDNAWFLDSMETTIVGRTFIERLYDSFVVVRDEVDGKLDDIWVIGYSDPQKRYQVFTYDQRGVARIFDMTFDGTSWMYSREDEDFYQRFVAQVSANRIQAYTEASEDKGKTWRKDFDITYVRKPA
jgi:hypothetical protein